MKILKFKTNVDNEDAVAQVAPILDELEGISKWNIDKSTKENILVYRVLF